MSSALRVFQRQLDVTGHNIANVDTPGYSRQRAELVQNEPTLFTASGILSLGNGVSISDFNRIRDMFLEGRRLTAGTELAKNDAQAESLARAESVMLEPGDDGISSALDQFYNSWSSLSSNPGSEAARNDVQAAGRELARRIRDTHKGLQSQEDLTNLGIQQSIADAQTNIDQIARLNEQIRYQSALGKTPADLLDQRDQAVRELSEKMDITVSTFSDGSYVVQSSGQPLVNTNEAMKLPTTVDPVNKTLSGGGITINIKGGEIAGQMEAINKINSYQSRLDTLANNLRTEVNAIHMTGTNQAGATGLKFFNDVPVTSPATPQTGAIDFDLDTEGVTGPPASAGVGTDAKAISAGVTSAAGDGGLATSMSKLRDKRLGALGNSTLGSYYQNLVGDIGRDVRYAESAVSTQSSVVEQIDNQIQSVSGVSLDEELADMLRFQRSYQAAARALSTMDSLLEDLLNMVAR